ncbi:Sensory/regulatory protein RpfC [Rosistilla carotiformis]|uniref:histidine kinase n=1 Tax=Rosistilla carotiformis TaxID=2528017 RepID=A0A518K031_9BACT|nr:PAS domain-containing hybrid sensor histidine kinase/response regulator [Rosistilla carotiformis]QDV71156.1 Sensory/regulatory protein RpfC [Rosistilla carotiformis]
MFSTIKTTVNTLLRPFRWLAGRLPTRVRIVAALVAMVVVSFVGTLTLQVFPNPYVATMEGRATFTEALAMSATTLISSGNREGLKALLEGIVRRQPDIISIGLRKPNGSLHVEAGKHAKNWNARLLERRGGQVLSTDRQMVLPVYQRSDKWAELEIAFEPYKPFLGIEPWKLVLILVAPACFIQFYMFLGMILKQLDASGAVPTHVRDVLDNLGVGLVLLDLEYRVLLANPVIQADLKMSQRQLLGQSASDLNWIAEEDDALPWTETLRRGAPLSNRLLGIEVEGKHCMFSVNSTPIQTSEGTCQGVMVTFKDITTLEDHKRELAIAKDAAELANETKSQFLANMSHEIRTPMNAIVGFTDVLRRGLEQDPDRQLEYLDTIYSSGNHLVELINDVLDLSKIESAGVQLEIRECSPFQIVNEVVTVLTGKANDQGIQLSSSAAGEIPETIQTDPTRLRQILINLVGNAVKFTESGGVRVSFVVIDGAHGPQMRFDVIDTGIGMNDEQLQRIFSPFVQADSSVTRRFGGTGLGLSISKKFAEAMGGAITVVSEPGEGSVFSVLIDVGLLEGVRMVSGEEAAKVLRSRQRAAAEQGIASVRPGKILIVDDTPANVQLLRLVCDKAGLTVDTAENGQVAIDKAAENRYDIILMDMQMPVMDGYSATTELRKRGIATPIVALTGNALEEDRRRCFDVGCTAFLAKPVNIDELIKLLRELHGVGDLKQSTSRTTQPIAVVSSTKDRPEARIRSSLPMDLPEFQQVVAQFVDGLDRCVEELQQAFQSGDYEAVARNAHALKGTGGTVGFPQFTEPSRQLEDAAKQGDEAQLLASIEEIQQIARSVERPNSPKLAAPAV